MAAALLTSAKIRLCNSTAPFRATAVIVLYRIAPEESPAYRSLMESRDKLPAHEGRVSILLWDNSPEPARMDDLPQDVTYWQDRRNPGLAAAYNKALEIALQSGSKWLITLDQDTIVPPCYLAQMASAARISSSHAGIGAIVPQIAVGEKLLSPNYFVFGAVPRWFVPGFVGIPRQPVFAFNSGAMIQADVLTQIGGYDLRFPLDHSDAMMFRRLHEYGKRVCIEGSIQLRHEFSMTDMNRRMTPGRYRSSLLAESAFWDLHMNWLAGCERTVRLFLRLLRQWARDDSNELRLVTLEFLCLRMFGSRKRRLRRWQNALDRAGRPVAVLRESMSVRPKVSVCMAAYNGSRFIEQQLESILPQLDGGDEVVIVDDCSRDDTAARVLAMNDTRIRLIRHETNEGIVSTFEEAMRRATGEILFLCDDDDLWAPTKVQRALREFEVHPRAQVVISRAALIDERGARLPDARVNRRGRFVPGFWHNIFMNHYQGSAMAIRASFLGAVLPFPRRKSFLHDVWIGTRNEVAGGKTVFIDEPLVFYRRHSQNASQMHNVPRQLRVRIELLLAHLARVLWRQDFTGVSSYLSDRSEGLPDRFF